MSDMLVKLYDLPDGSGLVADLKKKGVEIRRALPPEMHIVAPWVGRNFPYPGWVSECERAIMNSPVSCFLALEQGRLVGFACYDATCKAFFGPTGVAEACRGRGIGKALLWVTLRALAEQGYAYAIIAWVSSVEFYTKAVGATVIPDSEPGIFRGMLQFGPPGA